MSLSDTYSLLYVIYIFFFQDLHHKCAFFIFHVKQSYGKYLWKRLWKLCAWYLAKPSDTAWAKVTTRLEFFLFYIRNLGRNVNFAATYLNWKGLTGTDPHIFFLSFIYFLIWLGQKFHTVNSVCLTPAIGLLFFFYKFLRGKTFWHNLSTIMLGAHLHRFPK